MCRDLLRRHGGMQWELLRRRGMYRELLGKDAVFLWDRCARLRRLCGWTSNSMGFRPRVCEILVERWVNSLMVHSICANL